MSIKLLIFDLDGTLVDSRVDITNAINHALKDYGIGPYSVKEITSLIGRGITKLIEEIIRPHPGIPLKEVIEKFLKYYEIHIIDNTRPYPHVRETLEELRDYKKAVISNKREYLSKKTLEGLDLLKYFDMVLGSDSTPEKKPSPVPVFTVLETMNIRPDETVIIGDSELDVMTGKSAGIATIAVTYGYRPREMLIDADYIIDSIKDLPELLKRIRYSS
ncbi:MAG: HAD-IA family hydrolase [Thermodesulfovibrionales bacterium]|nr:HAD-IA family hydrolase [Thermodesulfovibrionales bacterium]